MNTAFRLFLIVIFTVSSSTNFYRPPSTNAALIASAPDLFERFATGSFSRLLAGSPPEVEDDVYSMDEEGILMVESPGVLENDNEPDAESMTATLETDVINGDLVFVDDGSFTYTPAENFFGEDSFTYTATDGDLTSAPATVTITVNEVNDLPLALDDYYTFDEDTILSVNAANGILANDTDVEASVLTVSVVNYPLNGTLALDEDNGSFTYEPDPNFAGDDSFTYQAFDGADISAVATVMLTGQPANDPPEAEDDIYGTNEDVTLDISAPGVLDNDVDFDADDLTATLVSGPTRGTLTLNADGSFSYTPNPNINGTDSFTYTAGDGLLSSTPASTVTIQITALNDPPVAVNDTYTMSEDATLSVPVGAGLLNNDTDLENNALSVVLVAGPQHGTLDLSSTGSFTYTPTANYASSDSFTYRANDGTDNSLNTGTVNITIDAVNDRPMANADSYTAAEDTQLSIALPGVLTNDTDIENSPLTAVLNTGPTRGTLALQSNGSFLYTPNPNLNGPDNFTYFANDGTINSLNPATVTINVGAVNDPPVAVADTFTATEDTALLVSVANGVLRNDSDVEGATLSAQLVTGPTHGSLLWNTDGSFTYTPSPNYSGADSFTYRAHDGAAESVETATASITVNPANDRPVGGADTYAATEDTVLTIASPGVLSNDSDVDGDGLTAVSFTQPGYGTLTGNVNGGFTYTPFGNYAGQDSFTYRVSDSTLTSEEVIIVTINVAGTNDAPVATADAFTTAEDSSLIVIEDSVLDNDTDVEGTPLEASLMDTPNNGSVTLNVNGTFNYSPNGNFHGVDTFTYTASDGQQTSQETTVTITVTPVNDRPVAVNDTASVNEDAVLTVAVPGVLTNDTDVDGDSLNCVVADQPDHGTLTLNSAGSYNYTPTANYHGPDSFTYFADDGVLTSAIVGEVSITVISVNDLPIAADDSYGTPEDTELNVAAPGILSNDTDIDNDPLTAVLAIGPTHGVLALDPDGSFTYTPTANYTGEDSFTYHANDTHNNSVLIARVTITVEPSNDAPVANADSYSTNEDTPLTITAPGILSNDSDIDADPLNAVLAVAPQHGELELNANGSFTYTPDTNNTIADSFTYYANDTHLNSVLAATVTITINPVNDAPIAMADEYDTAEDTPLIVAAPGVLSNDSDVDSPSLTAILVAGPTHGGLTWNADGSFTYSPSLNYNGPDSFTYRASDGSQQPALPAVTVDLDVTPVNDLPVANTNSYPTDEETPLTVTAPGLLANDTDVENNPLSAAVVIGPQHGALELATSGGFTYTPALNFNGDDTFTYSAADGEGPSPAATVTITVNPVNDAPLALADTYLAFDEDTTLTVALANSVLNNDTDVDSANLTAVVFKQPDHGVLTLDANGSFTFAPTANYNGPDSFQYRAYDTSLYSEPVTVSLTINPVNDAPAATANTLTVAEDTPGPITLTGTDLETPAQLTFAIVGNPTHGTLSGTLPNLTYTPALNYNGSDSFTFRARDPGLLDSGTATINITITPLNDAPLATADPYTTAEDTPLIITTPGVLGNDSDVDINTTLNAVISVLPTHGTLTLNSNGSFTYTSSSNYHGTDTFRYYANDGQTNSLAFAEATITISAVNDNPVAVGESYTTAEDTPLNLVTSGGVSVLSNDSDVDGDALTPVVVATPAHGTVNMPSSGLFTYTPAANYFGQDSFTYRASDGPAQSNLVTVNLTVTPVNDAPRTLSKSPSVVVEGYLAVEPADPDALLQGGGDVENDAFSAQLISGPIYGTLNIQPNGAYTYFAPHVMPPINPNDPNEYLHDIFTFRACETVSGLCGPASVVEVTIEPVQDPTVQVKWVSPVFEAQWPEGDTNKPRWQVGNENITLEIEIRNCPDCNVRIDRWDAVLGQFVSIATLDGETTVTIPSSILNSGWGLDGWNQIIANAVLPDGTKTSRRRSIYIIRLPFERPITRLYLPLGSGN